MRHKGRFSVALVRCGGLNSMWCEDRDGKWIHGEGPAYHSQGITDEVIERRDVTDEEWWKLLDEASESEWRAELARVREKVMAQCGGELIELVDHHDNVVARVPKAPFICYALARTSLRHMMPKWDRVSEQGMKLTNDCQYHSDWYYGGGFDNVNGRYPYDSPIHEAAVHTAGNLQHEYGRFQCAVLVSGEPVIGTVGEEIAVLPNLSMDHYDEARMARAIITEAGGALAHMAVVMREQGVPIVLVANARKLYPKGTLVNVNPQVGRVDVLHGEAPRDDDGEES